MKKMIFTLFLAVNISTAFAHDNKPLAEAMKEMGVHFKTIAIALQKGEMVESDLAASESLQYSIATANLYFPMSADTDALKLKYSGLMAELNKKALELESAIEVAMTKKPQELAPVLMLFQDMNELRKEGHDEFKGEH